jgi:4-hydroxythreonine-4-phosphate dehydrogenase
MRTHGSPIAVTLGEPAGIGPDIILLAHAALKREGAAFFVIGDARLIEGRARALGLRARIEAVASPADAAGVFPRALPVIDRPLRRPVEPGRPDPATAEKVIAWIDEAVALALAGRASAVVTGPISKDALYRSGFRHQGHTDYLAHLARGAGKAAEPVMMLSAGSLRTVPLTVHIPLKAVPAALSQDLIARQARVIDRDLSRLLGLAPVRIAVAGLNPHAGEGGAIGNEEVEIIAPAIARLKAEGLAIDGPFSADTLFHEEARRAFDVALCMYHDQALIPVKTVGFHEGVNTTLGLPFIRTSPDHGTALPLAGSGRVNPKSLVCAIALAGEFAERAGAAVA